MEPHINNIIRIINYESRRISQMRPYLDTSSIKTLITTLILSRLDYCNSLLVGLPNVGIDKLQRVQNRAARLALNLTPADRTSSLLMLKDLHWLPVRARIDFKIALLCYKAQNSLAPPYIEELLTPYSPSRSLRSTNSQSLEIPKTKLKRFGDRSFARMGPVIWNSLPSLVRLAGSEEVFKKRLKTFLFQKFLP